MRAITKVSQTHLREAEESCDAASPANTWYEGAIAIGTAQRGD